MKSNLSKQFKMKSALRAMHMADGGDIISRGNQHMDDAIEAMSNGQPAPSMAQTAQAHPAGEAPDGGPYPTDATPALDSAFKVLRGLGLRMGGPVKGPGGPTDDKIPAMLSNGEYVLPADTVRAVGKGNLDSLRAKTHAFTQPAQFADGGEPSAFQQGQVAQLGATSGGIPGGRARFNSFRANDQAAGQIDTAGIEDPMAAAALRSGLFEGDLSAYRSSTAAAGMADGGAALYSETPAPYPNDWTGSPRLRFMAGGGIANNYIVDPTDTGGGGGYTPGQNANIPDPGIHVGEEIPTQTLTENTGYRSPVSGMDASLDQSIGARAQAAKTARMSAGAAPAEAAAPTAAPGVASTAETVAPTVETAVPKAGLRDTLGRAAKYVGNKFSGSGAGKFNPIESGALGTGLRYAVGAGAAIPSAVQSAQAFGQGNTAEGFDRAAQAAATATAFGAKASNAAASLGTAGEMSAGRAALNLVNPGMGGAAAGALRRLTPVGMIQGAGDSFQDNSSGYRDKFASEMGMNGSPLAATGADTLRTLGDVGNRLTFGMAGKVGQGVSDALSGGKFMDGFNQQSDRDAFYNPAKPAAPAGAAAAPQTPEQAQAQAQTAWLQHNGVTDPSPNDPGIGSTGNLLRDQASRRAAIAMGGFSDNGTSTPTPTKLNYDGQAIFGTASKPGGKLDTFTGVGNNSNLTGPGGPNADSNAIYENSPAHAAAVQAHEQFLQDHANAQGGVFHMPAAGDGMSDLMKQMGPVGNSAVKLRTLASLAQSQASNQTQRDISANQLRSTQTMQQMEMAQRRAQFGLSYAQLQRQMTQNANEFGLKQDQFNRQGANDKIAQDKDFYDNQVGSIAKGLPGMKLDDKGNADPALTANYANRIRKNIADIGAQLGHPGMSAASLPDSVKAQLVQKVAQNKNEDDDVQGLTGILGQYVKGGGGAKTSDMIRDHEFNSMIPGSAYDTYGNPLGQTFTGNYVKTGGRGGVTTAPTVEGLRAATAAKSTYDKNRGQ